MIDLPPGPPLVEWSPCDWHATKITMSGPIEHGAYRFIVHEIQLSDNGDGTLTMHCARDVAYLFADCSESEAVISFNKTYGRAGALPGA